MIPVNVSQSSPGVVRFQRSVAGVCVALLLVGGLMTVPTTCECGAGIPHGHSIFVLQGHHHGPDNWWTTDGSSRVSGTHDHEVETVTQSGPQFAGKVAHGTDRLSLALSSVLTSANIWQNVSYPGMAHNLYAGPSDAPEAPPPQQPRHG